MSEYRILTQPDDTTCGPTCLESVYHFYQDSYPLPKVIEEVDSLETGGTLAVMLGIHALKRNYQATIYTYNLKMFDPTWFSDDCNLSEKLMRQSKSKHSDKIRFATNRYVEYLDLGGEIVFEDLTRSLLRRFLDRKIPIITGLSATYLYRCMREYGEDCVEDDIKGYPTGHFVVLKGYDRQNRLISVADPYPLNPHSKERTYSIHIDRVIGAILLGIVTYDANLLIITPKDI